MTFEIVPSKIQISSFQETFLDTKVLFQIVKFDGSILIVINDLTRPTLDSLSMAILDKFSKRSRATALLGAQAESVESTVAAKLAQRLNGQVVHLSLNVQDGKFLVPMVEKRIFMEINKYPEKFGL